METFAELKPFQHNPGFKEQREKSLALFPDAEIDAPIADLITGINRLPFCFTLQCCYGHFLYPGQRNTHNLEPLPDTDIIDPVEYRIAYITFCIEETPPGKELYDLLKSVPAMDPDYIQFCCAEWFWDRQVNTYSLQVEPERFKHQDTATVDFHEALHLEKTKNGFFLHIASLIEALAGQ